MSRNTLETTLACTHNTERICIDCPAGREWDIAHARYLDRAEQNAPIYRALRAQALGLGMNKIDFDASCRNEIDEDLAGDSSDEWIRAARVVLAAWANLIDPTEPDEGEAYRQAQWHRACNDALRGE